MLPESRRGTAFRASSLQSIRISKTPYAHHFSVGIDRAVARSRRADGELRVRARLQSARHDRLQPGRACRSVPVAVRSTSADVPGTSASVLQYTAFGETWYHGLTVSATKRFSERWGSAGQLHAVEGDDTSTDFQSTFLPQDNGRGRNPNDPTGLPLGFDPDSERGPSLQDQRHRLVAERPVSSHRTPSTSHRSSRVESGRPYNILAGDDLNGDGNGGTIPGPDRALRIPGDLSSSIGRNAGTLPTQVDGRPALQQTGAPSAAVPASTRSSTCSISSTAPTSPTSTTSSAPAPTRPTRRRRSDSSSRPDRRGRRSLR